MLLPHPVATFICSLIFASAFLVRWKPRVIWFRRRQRDLISLAAGASVAYVFLHVLPALEVARELALEATAPLPQPFEGATIYLGAMAGFVLYYGLEKLLTTEGAHNLPISWKQRLHIAVFGTYTWLVTYFLVAGHKKDGLALTLYAIAMLMHFISLNNHLRHRHGSWYDKGPSRFLAACTLAGLLCALLIKVPDLVLVALIAVVAGAILVNTMISELAENDKGSFMPFATGAFAYATLLLFAH